MKIIRSPVMEVTRDGKIQRWAPNVNDVTFAPDGAIYVAIASRDWHLKQFVGTCVNQWVEHLRLLRTKHVYELLREYWRERDPSGFEHKKAAPSAKGVDATMLPSTINVDVPRVGNDLQFAEAMTLQIIVSLRATSKIMLRMTEESLAYMMVAAPYAPQKNRTLAPQLVQELLGADSDVRWCGSKRKFFLAEKNEFGKRVVKWKKPATEEERTDVMRAIESLNKRKAISGPAAAASAPAHSSGDESDTAEGEGEANAPSAPAHSSEDEQSGAGGGASGDGRDVGA